jgi:FtsZ-binding cell division protein ZapB
MTHPNHLLTMLRTAILPTLDGYEQAADAIVALQVKYETLTEQNTVLRQSLRDALAERDKLIEQNNVLFDSALLAAQERDAAMADAWRYRWIKDQPGLELRAEHSTWIRPDGSKFTATHALSARSTKFTPQESLDAAIDAAMMESGNES